jgi:AcrR family transcriptional regulator
MQTELQNQFENTEKRGDSTRHALIQSGLELFGEYGYKVTTTRMLCEMAGANISAIPYYFGGKKGLYLAVMEYIAGRMQQHFGKLHARMGNVSEGPIPREQAMVHMEMMIRTLAQLFVESDEPKAWVQLIMREQANPTEAFDIIYDGQMKYVQRVFSTLIASCRGQSPDNDDVKLRGHALIGQILIFILSRESLLRHLNVSKLTPEHIEKIYAILLDHAHACMGIDNPELAKKC